MYAVAEKTYRMMMEETNPTRKNQSMIVSGTQAARSAVERRWQLGADGCAISSS